MIETGFDIDLALSEVAVDEVRNLLKAVNHVGERIRIEVKDDIKAPTTGNLFFETSYKGKPSGIAATKADWWWITFKSHGHMASIVTSVSWLRSKLKRLYGEGKAREVSGGDDMNSGGLVVPIEEIFKE